jgi:hypothetical protein
MGQVFTSYSRRDTETVDNIVEEMNQAGISVWIDREAIKAGNTWRVQIVQAIDTCDAFVLMLSPNSAASDNVRREIDLASESGRVIFALVLEPVKLPPEIRYQLAGLQFIDVKMLGLEKSVYQLIETLQEHIKKIQPVADQTNRQAELVIQGIDLSVFDPEKQEQLLAFIANLANADKSQLKIENATAGSVHVFMRMPVAAAYELKTLALNRDPRFRELGVVSLRLDGDAKFVNISTGKLMYAATVGPMAALWLKMPALLPSILGATAGKIATVVLAAAVITGIGISVPTAILPPSSPSLTPTSAPATPPTSTLPILTETFTSTPMPTLTATAITTATASLTATMTPTPIPTYLILRGVVANPVSDLIACRYGPGDDYLYRFGPRNGIQMDVNGQVEVRSGREIGHWLWVLLDGYQGSCWVNARYVQLNGEISSLETVYPGKAELLVLPSSTWRWPAPQNVSAVRVQDQVNIYWDFFDVPLGERESEQSPRYLLELWLCQDGHVAFTPIGTLNASLVVRDESKCSEPSHGVIYLAEKHGYIGPVEIQWPAYMTPTP